MFQNKMHLLEKIRILENPYFRNIVQNHLMLFSKSIGRNVINKRWHRLKLTTDIAITFEDDVRYRNWKSNQEGDVKG
jgi:hypothetical protein